MLDEIRNKRLVRDSLLYIRESVNSSKVFLPPTLPKFIFLCGANKDKDEVSERRSAIIDFAEHHLPESKFFLAEKVITTLKHEGNKQNLLDVEYLISEFSDYVLIVLESPSAFTELGAFSHESLRDKLIVVNATKFKGDGSFINLGPVKAISDSAGPERILHYDMLDDGVFRRDGIGDIYSDLYKIVGLTDHAKNRSIGGGEVDPSLNMNKIGMMFLHDILFMIGPALHNEVIESLKVIFGENKNYNNVPHLLAILCAFGSIYRDPSGMYRTNLGATYFSHRYNSIDVISVFRNIVLSKYPGRLYGD